MASLDKQIAALTNDQAISILTAFADAETRHRPDLVTAPADDLASALADTLAAESAHLAADSTGAQITDGDLARAALLALAGKHFVDFAGKLFGWLKSGG